MKIKTDGPGGMTKAAIVAAVKAAGVKEGNVVLVHSAMRTIGRVEEGPESVVEALLEAVGAKGTVVAPTFTFRKEAESDPIIDPRMDPSEMGVISEAVRRHPRALRSAAFRHSLAAIGRRAPVITETDPRLSPFDLRSSFGVLLALDAQILLLGVTYANATAFHACEWLAEVPYRTPVERRAKLRRPDGVSDVLFTDYQPKPTSDGSYYGKRAMDFNRVGSELEKSGKVQVAAMGNSVLRRFSFRDLFDYSLREMEKDYNIFRTGEDESGKITRLADGLIVLVELTDYAGRAGQHQMAVWDYGKFVAPAGASATLIT